jgi:hypothetical protein
MAIAPSARGLGCIVFESPEVPMDWGVKEVRKNKTGNCFRIAREMMDLLKPSVLVVEDAHHPGSRRFRANKGLDREGGSSRKGAENCGRAMFPK